MQHTYLFNIAFTILVMTLFFAGPNEAHARRSNRNAQRAMQQFQQQQMKLMQAQQQAAARQAAAIAAEQRRRFEMHQQASKARNDKIEADREAARERRLAEQKNKDATPARNTNSKP